jgi:L-alanine-DL-glutamate epimerase-like enolase superfamily enzyme
LRVDVAAYRIPTLSPESDGTFEWDATTLVTVQIENGFGFTYADTATATLIRDVLAGVVAGHDPMAIDQSWAAMIRAVRNLGRRGIAAMAISAVDAALWDLKCKRLGVPLVTLLGAVRESVPVYGSGGFTSQSIDELQELADHGVTWFEEPVSSDDLDGLRFIRERTPIEIAAGEYGYELQYFDEMIAAGAVDVLQADATRCCGITGFIKTAALCEARSMPLSAHCAPSLHRHLGCALLPLRHIEYFFDHARIESMLFDGFTPPRGGALWPDLSRPGIGVELKRADAERFRV